MAANACKTLRYSYQTSTGSIACTNSFGTTTRTVFGPLTVRIPETAARSFLSVKARISWHSLESGAEQSTIGVRVGAKFGAGSYTDSDSTFSGLSTTTLYNCPTECDFRLTSAFNSGFGSGSSQDVYVDVAVKTTANTTIAGLSVELFITYEYDESASATLAKSVIIPMDSLTAALTNSLQEIGTNQIPLLDTYLPEASKDYYDAYLVVEGSTGEQGAGSSLRLALDSEGESTRAAFLGFNAFFYRDVWKRADAATGDPDFTTSAAHAFKARTTIANAFSCLRAYLVVTYSYDKASTTRVLNQQIVPFAVTTNDGILPVVSTSYTEQWFADFLVAEPGTITLVQSAVLAYWANADGNAQIYVAVGGQTRRGPYLGVAHSNGPRAFGQRLDSGGAAGSGLTIARGANRISLDVYNLVDYASALSGAVAVVSYTSDVHSSGERVHARTTHWVVGTEHEGASAAYVRDFAAADAPVIHHEDWALSCLPVLQVRCFSNVAQANRMVTARINRGSAAYPGRWWSSSGFTFASLPATAIWHLWLATDAFARSSQATVGLDPESAVGYRLIKPYDTGACFGLDLLLTYSGITFAFADQVTGYSGNGAGITVNIHRDDLAPEATTVTNSGGSFSAPVFDPSVEYWAEAVQDGSHLGRSISRTP